MTVRPDTTAIADQLARCAEELDATERRATLGLFRILAQGAPVEPARLAERLGLDEAELTNRLGRRPGVHMDADGRIVAFEGLSVVEPTGSRSAGGRSTPGARGTRSSSPS